MARILPNLGLKAFFALGEDNWNNDVDTNFLKLSVSSQAVVEAMVSTKPSSPTEGTVYLLSESESSNPNALAVYDDAVWKFIQPKAGWIVYDKTLTGYRAFNGTVWKVLPINNPLLDSLSKLNANPGIVAQADATSFTKYTIGDVTPDSILTRAHSDVRYSAISHTHPNTIQTFNGRSGTVALLQSDVMNAISYIPQPASPILEKISVVNNLPGLLEHQGDGSFTKRPIGVATSTDILSRSFGDSRYTPLTPISAALSVLNSTSGLVEQNGTSSFAKRKIDDLLDGTSLLSINQLNIAYVRKVNLSFIAAIDTPVSFSSKAGYTLRVNDAENALEFAPAAFVNYKEVNASTYTLLDGDVGSHLKFTNAGSITVTIPALSCRIGTVVIIEQGNNGSVSFVGDAGVAVSSYNDALMTQGRHSVVRATKTSATEWLLSGDLKAVVVGAPAGSMLELQAISPLDLGSPDLDRIAKINDATGDRYLATVNGAWSTLLGSGSTIVPGFYFGRAKLPIGASVSRSLSAYVMSSSGRYVTVAANAPRFAYDPITQAYRGILVEPTRTNQLTYSNDYSGGTWTKTGGVVALSAITAPDGGSATQLLDNSDGTTSSVQISVNSLTMPSAGSAAFSIFVHSGTRSKVRFRLGGFTGSTGQTTLDADLTAGTLTAGAGTIQNFGSGWYRLSLLATLDAAGLSGQFIVQTLNDTGGSSLLRDGTNSLSLWVAQAETGAYVSTPILTNGTVITRPNDALTLDWASQLTTDGSVNVTYAFEDASTQVVASTISGGLLVAPTNLNSRYIKTVSL